MELSKISILVYELRDEQRNNIRQALADAHNLSFIADPKSFQKALEKKEYDIIFLHIRPDSENPFGLLSTTHAQIPYTPIIITSKSDRTELIVEAIKRGAYDYISAPFSPARIQLIVQKAIKERKLRNEIDYLRREQDIVYDFNGIVAKSPSFKKIIAGLKKFAETDATILLTGKTGTGKSFLAGSIHFNSPRRANPFIKINCTNIPETLLESELFGHEKGSFTGADKQRIGRFEQADGGTLFLDEIGEIPLEIQAKLLRVIEEKSFERVGGNKTIQVDVRVIAATNRNLEEQIIAGKFREDLFYRINVLPVTLPDLKDRPLCIAPLAMTLLDKTCCNLKKSITGFSPAAMAIIKSYQWPGNIRQLANTIERAVILEEGSYIEKDAIHIPEFHLAAKSSIRKTEPLEKLEKKHIVQALEENLWVQKNAAAQLGISPRSLNYKIQKFSITHANWRKNK